MADDPINQAVDKLLTPEGIKTLEGELNKVEGKGDPELGELCNYFENTTVEKIVDEVNKYGKPLVDIDLTGQAAFSWPNKEIEGWNYFRIEYGGCNENCYYEGSVWLPPEVDAWKWTEMFEILQIPEARKKLEEAISKIHKEDVGERSNWRNSDDSV